MKAGYVIIINHFILVVMQFFIGNLSSFANWQVIR